MIVEPKIKIQEYSYILPDERIAKYPLEKRDSSKLLIYNNGGISQNIFTSLPSYLPEGSLMVFNNTKVVPARLLFRKETGAVIEIFCLEPVDPMDYALSFASVGCCSWNVVIGNARKWKGGDVYFICDDTHKEAQNLNLRAELVQKGDNNGSIVKFKWDGNVSFSEVLDICGRIPIPPYLNRDTEELDLERYQTLYARIKGSVAAPTAGLHFTDNVLQQVRDKGIDTCNVCLHVGAGTFVPVKSEYIADHKMHTEPFEVTKEFLLKLRDLKDGAKVISVGTTSTRTLESLYFIGVQCIENGEPGAVQQWEPYRKDYNYTLKESVGAIVEYMERNGMEKLVARTGIIIVPSYKFRVVDVLVTNFHQPQSTLLLLISAFIGGDWKSVYNYALDNGFRFLSYGDSSLLFRVQR
ncbi:MAG: S-adenosylmethionine:tRNA ribosyltransferase-isomerase [Bacteroidales bacterium]|nr:S-adenosylmethionine:tRNA ribosyltransferase-isomerase [Bacteroidales bacterium]